jgi:hypothetical protein
MGWVVWPMSWPTSPSASNDLPFAWPSGKPLARRPPARCAWRVPAGWRRSLASVLDGRCGVSASEELMDEDGG